MIPYIIFIFTTLHSTNNLIKSVKNLQTRATRKLKFSKYNK